MPARARAQQLTSPVGPPAVQDVRVSVVVCAFTERRWDQLQRAVESLHRQSRRVDEVLVVIDHNDALLETAAATLDARVLRNTAERGLSGARNTGVSVATGDVVAFLDDDAYAEPDWLECLLDAYDDPAVMAVGGDVQADFDGVRPSFLPPEFDWVVGCSYRGLPTGRAQVRNMIGANMSFRRLVFERAGGFEVSLGRVGDRPFGCEETELCIRAAAAWPGGKVLLQPTARVHHHVPAARMTWGYFLSRCYSEGLSKAAVARLAGRQRGLASERRYVTRTLPAGVVHAVTDAVRTGRTEDLARAAAIVAGLVVTTVGYVRGAASQPGHGMAMSAKRSVDA